MRVVEVEVEVEVVSELKPPGSPPTVFARRTSFSQAPPGIPAGMLPPKSPPPAKRVTPIVRAKAGKSEEGERVGEQKEAAPVSTTFRERPHLQQPPNAVAKSDVFPARSTYRLYWSACTTDSATVQHCRLRFVFTPYTSRIEDPFTRNGEALLLIQDLW